MQKDYYVYQLRIEDDELPFYVGKGRARRAYKHFACSVRDDNKHKKHKIEKALRESKEIHVEFLKIDLSEDDAFMWEVFYIAEIGRIDRNEGPLVNHSDGGEGSSGRYASDETKQRLRDAAKIKPRVACEYCKLDFNAGMFARYHGPKCKHNPNNTGIIRQISESHKEKLRKPREHSETKIECSVCKRFYRPSHISRYHESNCRFILPQGQ